MSELTRYEFVQPDERSRNHTNKKPKYEVYKYLENLEKFTEYTLWVRAVNSKGHGALNSPEGYRIRTLEDGKFAWYNREPRSPH